MIMVILLIASNRSVTLIPTAWLETLSSSGTVAIVPIVLINIGALSS